MTCDCLFHSDRSSFETTRKQLVKSKWIPRTVSHRLGMAVCYSCKRNEPLPGLSEITASCETLKQILPEKVNCPPGLIAYITNCIEACSDNANSESEGRFILILLQALEGDFTLLQQVSSKDKKVKCNKKDVPGKQKLTPHQIECMLYKRKKRMMMSTLMLPLFPGNVKRLEEQLNNDSVDKFGRSNKCMISFSHKKNAGTYEQNVKNTYINVWTKDTEIYKTVREILLAKSRQVQQLQDDVWEKRRRVKKERTASCMQDKLAGWDQDFHDHIAFTKETLQDDFVKKLNHQRKRRKQRMVILQGGHCLQCGKPFTSLDDNSLCNFHSGYTVSNKHTRRQGIVGWTCCGQLTATDTQREHIITGCCSTPQHVWRTSCVKTVRTSKQSRSMKHGLTAQELTKLQADY